MTEAGSSFDLSRRAEDLLWFADEEESGRQHIESEVELESDETGKAAELQESEDQQLSQSLSSNVIQAVNLPRSCPPRRKSKVHACVAGP
jgi:hypothetical protein